MRSWPRILGLVLFFLISCGEVFSVPFVVFPKAKELVSPDGRFVVRNAPREGSSSDFVGTFNTLWLLEIATGHSSKLCDYLGVAAAAWSSNDFLVVTQYVTKKTSRALIFSVTDSDHPVVMDKNTLIRLVPEALRPTLEGNDHVFVEALRVEEDALHLRVWGYGHHNVQGFLWSCVYAPRQAAISCTPGHH